MYISFCGFFHFPQACKLDGLLYGPFNHEKNMTGLPVKKFKQKKRKSRLKTLHSVRKKVSHTLPLV